MEEKKLYEVPTVVVVEVKLESAILAVSNPFFIPDYFPEEW